MNFVQPPTLEQFILVVQDRLGDCWIVLAHAEIDLIQCKRNDGMAFGRIPGNRVGQTRRVGTSFKVNITLLAFIVNGLVLDNMITMAWEKREKLENLDRPPSPKPPLTDTLSIERAQCSLNILRRSRFARVHSSMDVQLGRRLEASDFVLSVLIVLVPRQIDGHNETAMSGCQGNTIHGPVHLLDGTHYVAHLDAELALPTMETSLDGQDHIVRSDRFGVVNRKWMLHVECWNCVAQQMRRVTCLEVDHTL